MAPIDKEIDLKQLEIDIRNKTAQEYHWRTQQQYWIGATSLIAFGLILNFFKG